MTAQQQYTVAVLGATGLVGAHLMAILEERNFPIKTLKPLASERSAGKSVLFRGREIGVIAVSAKAFEGVDIVLASAGGDISRQWVPVAVEKGCVVIDNTSCYRMMDGVPLVVAGVNDADAQNHPGVIANPNCSTAQLMPVLKALDDAFGLERVIVSTYQSVSGAGKKGMDELIETSRSLSRQMDSEAPEPANGPENRVFSRPIAFNLVPQIDKFIEAAHGESSIEDGYTKEETKVIHESRKILHRPDLRVTCTAVRVPVMIGHSEAVTVECRRPVSPSEAMDVLEKAKHVTLCRTPDSFPTPVEATGQDPVYVGRIRRDTSNPETGLNLWVVADNLRIGAALNAVRIAELLIENNWLQAKTRLAQKVAIA
jgi:aspartate-semialdehyde dehydrogenase